MITATLLQAPAKVYRHCKMTFNESFGVMMSLLLPTTSRVVGRRGGERRSGEVRGRRSVRRGVVKRVVRRCGEEGR